MEKKLTSYQKLKQRVEKLENEVRQMAIETPEGLMYKLQYKIEHDTEMQILKGISADG